MFNFKILIGSLSCGLLTLSMASCSKAEQQVTEYQSIEKQPVVRVIPPLSKSDSQQSNVTMVAERQFDFKPVTPSQDALSLGVGAIGASELTSLVVKMDGKKNWRLEARNDDKSLIIDGKQSEQGIQERLQEYLQQMKKQGVAGKNMYFIISSGAIKSGNADVLISNLRSLGYVVNEITPEMEGKYAFKATVPNEYRKKSFMVDIGSGNTKISWEENGKLRAIETYGSKYFEKNISDQQVMSEVSNIIQQIPKANQEYVFIIGGVPYTLAKPIRQNKQRYVVLNAPTSYTATDDKQKSGLVIYQAMVSSTGTTTNYVFDFDSHYAIGFLQGIKQ